MSEHLRSLLQPLQELQARGEGNLLPGAITALNSFPAALEEAKKQIDNVSNKSYYHMFLTSRKDRGPVRDVNNRLSVAHQELSLLLRVHQCVPSSSISQEAWGQEDRRVQRTGESSKVSVEVKLPKRQRIT